MHGLYLVLGALAIGLVNAHQYPNCESDGCYRNLIDPRFVDEADKFCVEYLSGTTTAPSAIPTNFNNCNGDVTAVSSACSCITFSLTSTSTSQGPTTNPPTTATTPTTPTTTTTPTITPTTVVSITSSSSAVTASPTSALSSSVSISGSKSTASSDINVSMTTSTIYTTSVYTVTSCAPTVVNCSSKMGHVTTETIAILTTVCPVSQVPISGGSVSTAIYPTTAVSSAAAASRTSTIGTSSSIISKTTSSGILRVTAAAGRISNSFEIAAVAAGVVAVAFL